MMRPLVQPFFSRFQPLSAVFQSMSATFRRIGHSRSPGQTSPRRYLWLTLARRPPWTP
jgi:hypothetical protein